MAICSGVGASGAGGGAGAASAGVAVGDAARGICARMLDLGVQAIRPRSIAAEHGILVSKQTHRGIANRTRSRLRRFPIRSIFPVAQVVEMFNRRVVLHSRKGCLEGSTELHLCRAVPDRPFSNPRLRQWSLPSNGLPRCFRLRNKWTPNPMRCLAVDFHVSFPVADDAIV